MNLKFLFIVDSFPPLNNQSSLRALEISKRLFKEDKYPLILTRRVLQRQPKDYSLIKMIPRGLEIYKTPIIELKKKYSLKTLFFKMMAKILNIYYYIHWIPFAYLTGKELLKKKKDIKFIYSTGPPFYSHIIAYLLKKKFNVPLFIEYRDPWSFSPYSPFKKGNLTQNINLKIERKILRSADVIIVISSALKSFLIEKFPLIKQKPIYSIENGLNLKEYPLLTEVKDNKIIFTFIGTLYGKRDIKPLLNLFSILKKEKMFENLKFTLKIFGKYDKESLNRIINNLNIQDLVFLGEYLTRSQIFEEIKGCTLTVHIGENLDYPTIGFKVWDYLSCRKKILYLGREDSYTANFLKKNDFGVVIPINDLKKGREFLKNLLFEINFNKFNNTIDKEKIENFTWDKKVKKLEMCIEENL